MQLLKANGISDIAHKIFTYPFYDIEKSGDWSASRIIKPIQMSVLLKKYDRQIKVYSHSLYKQVFGSIIHLGLEQLNLFGGESEKRITIEYMGWIITGKPDVLVDVEIKDWKTTSAWTLFYGSRSEEWKQQLSIYRWLKNKESGLVLSDGGEIIALLLDWDEELVGKSGYPEFPIMSVPVRLMSLNETEEFVSEKLCALAIAFGLTDNDLPPCTDKERWYNKRKNKYIRCEKYCLAREFCQQVNKEKI